MPGRAIPYVKVMVHVVCLWPFLYLMHLYWVGALATLSDPVKFITHFTGDWALRMLLITLAVTPVRRLHPGLGWVVRFRRMLGLYCFFYATLHLATYVFLFSGYDTATVIAKVRTGELMEPFRQFAKVWPTMVQDAQRRKFVPMGLFAWLILLALALTSTQYSIRSMGGYAWNRLHSWIYIAAIAAVIHFWWQQQAGVWKPWLATVVLAILLLSRVWVAVRRAVRAWHAAKLEEQRDEVSERL